MRNFIHLTLACYSSWAPRTKTEEDLLNAWHGGADFKIYDGPYCSVRDLEAMTKDLGIEGLILHYRSLVLRVEL